MNTTLNNLNSTTPILSTSSAWVMTTSLQKQKNISYNLNLAYT